MCRQQESRAMRTGYAPKCAAHGTAWHAESLKDNLKIVVPGMWHSRQGARISAPSRGPHVYACPKHLQLALRCFQALRCFMKNHVSGAPLSASTSFLFAFSASIFFFLAISLFSSSPSGDTSFTNKSTKRKTIPKKTAKIPAHVLCVDT